MNWEPAVRTLGRSLRADLDRLLTIANPRGSLYRDAHYYSATVEIADPDAMRQWLPAGLRLAEPARADVFTAWFPDYNFGDTGYHEAAIFVHVKTLQGTGIHCPWMILDDDVALILGREGAGYPKKLGEITWSKTDTEIRAEAGRRGHKLLTMSGRLGEIIQDAPPFLGRPHRNVMGLIGVAFPSWLVGFTPAEKNIEVRRVEDFTLEISGSERDPLDQMGLGRVVEARLHRVDLFSTNLPPIPLRPLSPLFAATHLRPRIL
ncbi:acetoacetate decarboxylase family protein [Nocardia sp. NPDC005825]|uniref:acetoacetate decarboxylase family protein n=1 Tax=unclassified Nocardia TaxID=2637762 RepID=UPI0033D33EFA